MVLERRTELVRLTEAAVAVALSVLLGSMRLVELPNGGSIALTTMPLLALAVARGPRIALLAGACAGAAHAFAGGTIIHPVQWLLDYVLAYAVLAAAGIGRPGIPDRSRLAPRIVLAMALHLACVVTSGMIFFAPVAGSAALAYCLTYNAATVVPETLLAIWLVPPLVRAVARANPADSWRRGLLEPPRMHARTPRSIHVPAPIDTPATRLHVSHPPQPSIVRAAPRFRSLRFERPATACRIQGASTSMATGATYDPAG
jgi:thiamine transporter